VFERDGAKVVVDESSLELVKGATIDYVQEMIKSAFAIVNNPQSESACGCGTSFAVKNFAANPAKD
jgi:iron-sulfur cluster assembly accessory protein